MKKFEIGDTVKLVALDSREGIYTDRLLKYMECTGTIRSIRTQDHCIKVEFKDGLWYVKEEWLELVEKANKKKYYNGKVVCVHYPSDDPALTSFTVGKVYSVKDGIIYDNEFDPYNDGRPFESIDEFNKSHSIAKFIEFKGFAK